MLSLMNRFRVGSSAGMMVMSSTRRAEMVSSLDDLAALCHARTLGHRVGRQLCRFVNVHQQQTEIATASGLSGLQERLGAGAEDIDGGVIVLGFDVALRDDAELLVCFVVLSLFDPATAMSELAGPEGELAGARGHGDTGRNRPLLQPCAGLFDVLRSHGDVESGDSCGVVKKER